MELFKVELSAVETAIEQQHLDATNQLNELNLVYAGSGGMGDVIGV